MNFRTLVPAEAWQDLIERGQRRVFQRETMLLRQGESSTNVIALTDGIVKVTQADEQGHELPLMLRGPGEVLGEMGTLLDRPRSATITAVRACTGFVMQAHAFRGFLERHGLEFAVYRLAVERMNSHEQLRADLVRLSPLARMAKVVQHLSAEVGCPLGDGRLLLELGMTRTELSAMAAMSRSSGLAALSRLQSDGVLELGRRRLVIKDRSGLDAVAERRSASGE